MTDVNFNIRKIKRSEIKKAAKIMAESFQDYPLYDVFFPDKSKRVKLLTCFYTVSLFARRDYTYVTDDLSFVGCLKYPGQKMRSLALSFFHPVNFFFCLPILRPSYLKMMNELSEVSKEVREKYYRPEKDVFIEAICIRSDSRTQLSFFKLFRENYKGESIYAETADPKLVKLYSLLGVKEKATVAWRGVVNHALVREVPPEKQN